MKLVVLCCLLPFAVLAAELPEPVFPAGVGVNIHFVRGHEADLDMINVAGFKWVRMDFAWSGTESKPGEYNWSAYDELTANLEKRGLRAIYILDYSNPLYEAGVTNRNPFTQQEQRGIASPQHPESIAAFARWAAAAATHFHGREIIWEIWNDPNISFWKPKPSARQYTELALATSKAIRAADPKALIIGPACSGFDWKFLNRFLGSGILNYLDAVSVHPYRDAATPPETVAADYQKLRALIAKYAIDEKKQKLPIISGEWGYSSKAGSLSPEIQAAFIARQQLVNALNDIPISIWYDWQNDGPNPNENEHNFGIITHDGHPKPAYLSIRILTQQLAGCRILRRFDLVENDYVLLCVDSSGGFKLAAWTTETPHAVTIDLPYKTVHRFGGIGGDGERYQPKLENGRMTIELAPLPKYITIR